MNQDTLPVRSRARHPNEKGVVVHLSRGLVNTMTDHSHGTDCRRNDYDGTIPLLPQLFGNDRRDFAPTDVKEPSSPLGKPMELAKVS